MLQALLFLGLDNHLDRFGSLGYQPESFGCFCERQDVGDHVGDGERRICEELDSSFYIDGAARVCRDDRDLIAPDIEEGEGDFDTGLDRGEEEYGAPPDDRFEGLLDDRPSEEPDESLHDSEESELIGQ